MTTGAQFFAKALKTAGVDTIFGLVGIPVVEIADACIAEGIRFIAFRNEQAASYAASIYGYLTGKPGVLLVVGGPGVVHALAGVVNANVNRWPLVVLAGSSETSEVYKGAFQEEEQVALLQPLTKFAGRVAEPSAFPFVFEKAYRTALFGKPGATYVDLPADVIQKRVGGAAGGVDSGVALNSIKHLNSLRHPVSQASAETVAQCADILTCAKAPLVIIGKGAAYARCEAAVRQLVAATGLSFLPTPMGKGIVPDSAPQNVSAARSAALRGADVILVLGARLNWMLHFGEPPRFRADATFVQFDNSAEELGNGPLGSCFGVYGDLQLNVAQLVAELQKRKWTAPRMSEPLLKSIKVNTEKAAAREAQLKVPLTYHSAYKVIREVLERQPQFPEQDIIYVAEGANTMDISRVAFPLRHPRRRLDCGTNSAMGLGLGYAVAAKAAEPQSLVVAIVGDSAFGFSGLEVETAVRAELPLVVIVMNNSGIYHGSDPNLYTGEHRKLPSTALSLETQYHVLGEALGAQGYLIRTGAELQSAVAEAVASNAAGRTSVLNVLIEPGISAKLEFGWQSKKGKEKL